MEGPISGYVKLMDSVRPGIIFSAKASSEEFGLCWSYREHRDIHGCVPIKCEVNLVQGLCQMTWKIFPVRGSE